MPKSCQRSFWMTPKSIFKVHFYQQKSLKVWNNKDFGLTNADWKPHYKEDCSNQIHIIEGLPALFLNID